MFVFAITQVTTLIARATRARPASRVRALLLVAHLVGLGRLRVDDERDLDREPRRADRCSSCVTRGCFFMALAVPGALRRRRPVVRRRRTSSSASLARRPLPLGPPRRSGHQARSGSSPRGSSLAPLDRRSSGGFLDGDARAGLWLASLAIDVLGALTRRRRRLPRLRRAFRRALRAVRHHRARRVDRRDRRRGRRGSARRALRASRSSSPSPASPRSGGRTSTSSALGAERALPRRRSQRRGPVARDIFTFFHFPFVLGIIFFAVAREEDARAPGRAALRSRPLGARARCRRLPARLGRGPLPGRSAGSPGSARSAAGWRR